jgi:hypothetical protein
MESGYARLALQTAVSSAIVHLVLFVKIARISAILMVVVTMAVLMLIAIFFHQRRWMAPCLPPRYRILRQPRDHSDASHGRGSGGFAIDGGETAAG